MAGPEYCDLVMKGGITSGIVYPPAVCELASKYYFRNIGGTSVGAIAAVATAAAELGRRRGDTSSYDRLRTLPIQFAQPQFLLSLFRPDPDKARVMQLLWAAWQESGVLGRLRAISGVVLRHWFLAVLVGLLVGAAVPILLYLRLGGPRVPFIVLGVLWLVVGTAGVVIYTLGQSVVRALAGDGFGLCSGYAADPDGQVPPLTNWLHDLTTDLAHQTTDTPLTFKDLWEAPAFDAETDLGPRVIDLEVITTNLTHGRPYRVPLDETEWKNLYFAPTEWERLFPPDIMRWLEAKSRPSERKVVTADGTSVMPLPAPEDLPLLVAARMSMSFPVLFTAVPLWAVDFTRTQNQHDPPQVRAERCWFSDGGISSNFPIHLFDAPVPRWPTFGINLKKPHPDHDSTDRDLVWLPTNNQQGQSETWDRWEEKPGARRIGGFASAILNTMQEWRDTLQTRVPGFRDRVVHVSIKDGEGGLNLDMNREMVTRLSARGTLAGKQLRDEFSWPNHVWVRYRSTMGNVERFLARLVVGYRHTTLLQTFLGSTAQPSYRMTMPQREFANKATEEVATVSDGWTASGQTFTDGEPRPIPVLRGTPRV